MEIIANIGFNWYSADSKKRAEELITSAANNGAHAVIIPSFRASSVYSEDDMIKKTKQYEMPREWFFDLKDMATEASLDFIVSPRYPEALDYFEQIGVQRYHVQNGDIRYYPLLRELKKTGKPILLSTGYALDEEIKEAIETLGGNEDNLVLLHSTGGLPTYPQDAILTRILDLATTFFPIYVGLESFYSEPILDVISMTYNPSVIVRRYDLEDAKGIESHYSLNPTEFKNLARIAGVMRIVNSPKYYIDNFTETDFEARVNLMRCEHSDYLLPPEH